MYENLTRSLIAGACAEALDHLSSLVDAYLGADRGRLVFASWSGVVADPAAVRTDSEGRSLVAMIRDDIDLWIEARPVALAVA